MQQVRNKISKISLESFLLFWAITFGALVRFAPVIGTSFPLNDGGLFYTMVQDLINARFSIPFYTTYNLAHIPFAYPPIPFYITALLSWGFNIPLMQLMRWLPALITTLTIPAFYLLAHVVLRSRLKAGLATVGFGMVPRAFDLFVQGGGLTRSFGALFSILTIYNVYQLYAERKKKYIFNTVVVASLLVCSHPELTFHTFFIVALLWLFLGRRRQSTIDTIFITLGVIFLTSPWWLTVLIRHGFSPFQSIMQSGWHHLLFWTPFLTLNFANERFLGIITIFGILGFIACLVRKEYLLVSWLVVPFLIEPRNPYFSAIIPLTMLMSIGIDDVARPALSALKIKNRDLTLSNDNTSGNMYINCTGGILLLTFFLVYTLINAFAFSLQMTGLSVNLDENSAMEWIVANTAERSSFLLLTYGDPFNTPVQEWFPAVTHRVSLTTVQGYEWLPGKQFYQRRDEFNVLMRCLFDDVNCVEKWANEQGYAYDFVYIDQGIIGESPSNGTTPVLGRLLVKSMDSSPCYDLIYVTELIKIYSHDSTNCNTLLSD